VLPAVTLENGGCGPLSGALLALEGTVDDERHDRALAYALRAQPLFRLRRPLLAGGSPWDGVGYDDPAARRMMALLADYCLAVAREAGDPRVRLEEL
jgi:hypothetical protein